MQTELQIRTPQTEPTLDATDAHSYAADIGELSKCLAEMRRARTPESHAIAADAALNAVMPSLERTASLFAAIWPTEHVDVEDLVQEVLFEVAASLDTAPFTKVDGLAEWLSSFAFATLRTMRCRACDRAAHDVLVRAR